MDLSPLSCALAHKDSYKAFNMDNVLTLLEKKNIIPCILMIKRKLTCDINSGKFIDEAHQKSNLKNLSTVQELYSCLIDSFALIKYC
jgi:hypothetical protein